MSKNKRQSHIEHRSNKHNPERGLDPFCVEPAFRKRGRSQQHRAHDDDRLKYSSSRWHHALRIGGLTFDMRGGRKWAKPACGRALDGRVRPRVRALMICLRNSTLPEREEATPS